MSMKRRGMLQVACVLMLIFGTLPAGVSAENRAQVGEAEELLA
jgi:hypothetical protein